MNGMKISSERRSHDRFQVQDGAYAVLRPQLTQLGPIIDINQGGLAFRYPVIGGTTSDSSELDIFLMGDGFCLERVPFKAISDRKIAKKKNNGSVPMRRCGVKFGELKPAQLSQLEHFMRKHTRDKAQQTSNTITQNNS